MNKHRNFNLVCSKCGNSFTRFLSVVWRLDLRFLPICDDCVGKKISEGMKKKHADRIKNTPYEKLGYFIRKLICWEDQGRKCNICGFDKYNLETGPYELHHKDKDRQNRSRENEEVVCCNCHFMTEGFRFKGRTHNEKTRQFLKRNTLTYYAKQRERKIEKGLLT